MIVQGHVGDSLEVCMSLRAPCRLWDEVTAPYIILWQPIGHASDGLPRLMQNDTQIRSQDPIGLAFFSFPEYCALPNSKVFQFINFAPEAEWIKALVAFESLLPGNDLLCVSFHCASIGGNRLHSKHFRCVKMRSKQPWACAKEF